MSWMALDVGGANLKVADGRSYAASYPFPLWKQPNQLVDQLRTAMAQAPTSDQVAVTMTGELADCFLSKRAGVEFILRSVSASMGRRPISVYLQDGRLVDLDEAMASPALAASSNWHALAAYCGRFARTGPALLIDVGSTTVDLVPLLDGRLACIGLTDTQRLVAGELVYTGIERSPVCALVQSLTLRDTPCPVAQELFATTRDVYLLLEHLPEDPQDSDTADSRPATRDAACRRMGRMLCVDDGQFELADAVECAQQVMQIQLESLALALEQVVGRVGEVPQTVILSGHGSFLAQRVLDSEKWTGQLVSLEEELGASVTRCAPAHALAVLAGEELRA